MQAKAAGFERRALGAAVKALQKYTDNDDHDVQTYGMWALRTICAVGDVKRRRLRGKQRTAACLAEDRSRSAAEAGAIDAVVASLRANPDDRDLQDVGQAALWIITQGAPSLKQAAKGAGARDEWLRD